MVTIVTATKRNENSQSLQPLYQPQHYINLNNVGFKNGERFRSAKLLKRSPKIGTAKIELFLK